jgi:hypothetical protein
MEQSHSWEISSHSHTEKVTYLLRNLKIQYDFHKSMPLDFILDYKNSVNIIIPKLFKMLANITVPSMFSSPSGLSSGFSTKILCEFLISPVCATCSAHVTLLDLITLIISGEMYELWSCSLCSFLQPPVISITYRLPTLISDLRNTATHEDKVS